MTRKINIASTCIYMNLELKKQKKKEFYSADEHDLEILLMKEILIFRGN